MTEEYLGSKYSEYLFPEGRVLESNLTSNEINEERKKSEKNKSDFWMSFNKEMSLNYQRPCFLSKYIKHHLLLYFN